MGKREIFVLKRDGSKEPCDVAKFQRQVEYACDGIHGVSQSMIEMSMDLVLYDGIKTSDIDQLAINAARDLIASPEGHTNYQYVAGRLQNSVLRKDVYKSFTPKPLLEIVKTNIEKGLYTPELLEWYSESEWNLIESFVDHSKDEKLSYAAVRQFIDKYLVRNRATGEMVETPQVRYIIAAATAMHAEKENRLRKVNDYYKHVSSGHFTLATPVLAGLGTRTKQFSSCVVLKTDDTLDSIFATGEMMAKYASKRAGIGLEIGRLRPAGSPIRGGEIAHTGLIPFIKKWLGDLRSCSQGGIRNASATLSYPVWHYEFPDLIVLKNNQGTEENRVRQLDYNVVTSKYFWRKFKNKEMMTLFDPNEVPDLYEAYYTDQEEFIRLYEKYEKKSGLRKRVVNASHVFNDMIRERTDTGRIYLMFIDNVINQAPVYSKLHPVYSSNLCQEILLPTAPFQRLEDTQGRIALCTLASQSWAKFKRPEDLRSSCRMAVRSLDNLLMYQDFLSVQSALSNQDFRPLGIGVTGLAHWHAQRKLKYGTPEALKEVARWMEHQAYYVLEATIDLAEERGPCDKWKDTIYADGKVPIDVANENARGLFELTLDWDKLRERAKRVGVRNAYQGAIAPVESSSVVIDETNGIEMIMSLISTKESKGGSLVQVAPEYEKLKDHYQLMWDQEDCLPYLMTAAVLATFMDQSISTNTFYSGKHFREGKIPATLVASNIMTSIQLGLKTLYYSLLDKSGVKEGVLKEHESIDNNEHQQEDCESCKL